jgi:hypothetical protein
MPKRSVVATALVVSLVTVAAVSMTARQESVLNRVLPPGHVFCREGVPSVAATLGAPRWGASPAPATSESRAVDRAALSI